LGTSFSVRASGDSIELTVLTGKVNITMAGSGADVDVLPNEKVIFPRNGDIEKIALATDEVSSITSGTEYSLMFNNVSLSDITARLEKKFNTDIAIENPRAGACSITIDLTDKSLERSLEMITEILDVDIRREGGSITVSGQGCKE
jgi:ferric-dicitrate binding protein FerR (iron transport regulator)